MCTYLWNHHHSQGSKHIHHLQSLFSVLLYCVVVVLVGRALTVTSALLMDCDAYSTELFTLSTVLGSRFLEFTRHVQLRLDTHWRWRSPLHLSIKLLATPTLLSASGSLPVLNFLQKWNHEIPVFLRCSSVLQIHPCTHTWQGSLLKPPPNSFLRSSSCQSTVSRIDLPPLFRTNICHCQEIAISLLSYTISPISPGIKSFLDNILF